MGKDFVIFDLKFYRKRATGRCELDSVEASLYRAIALPSLRINQVSTGELTKQLKDLPAGTRAVMVRKKSVKPDIAIALKRLQATEAGSQVAMLVTARYLPGYQQQKPPYYLAYDATLDRYHLRRSFKPEGKSTVQQWCGELLGEMNLRTCQLGKLMAQPLEVDQQSAYRIIAKVVMLKTGAQKEIAGTTLFADASQATALLTGIDGRMFDKEYVKRYGAGHRWYLQQLSLVTEPGADSILTVTAGRENTVAVQIPYPGIGPLTLLSMPAKKTPAGSDKFQQTIRALGLQNTAAAVTTTKLPSLKQAAKKKRRPRGL
jgi:hypothetical protein